ncbi:hypothetical protein K504DRAFT_425974 [Pleomassaria siparia CBS 279.74]|uniref:GRF-like zinc ribbon domain-containing protein n=1 Tax=Pleomassaria siparia CBS 279.74 TaxID=1314801 RepID=A0A6G1KGW8_9PLEO|nr:hypothetical protein K504DRAFT_425974 [Pleomassaria siparia CBS 279.74]
MFPLKTKPTCSRCGTLASDQKIVSPDNENGNANRPYYICSVCDINSRWITWNDARGVGPKNPVCDCIPSSPSRQDRAGKSSKREGYGFWTCATGTCLYYSEMENGLTQKEANSRPDLPGSRVFKPWLLPNV